MLINISGGADLQATICVPMWRIGEGPSDMEVSCEISRYCTWRISSRGPAVVELPERGGGGQEVSSTDIKYPHVRGQLCDMVSLSRYQKSSFQHWRKIQLGNLNNCSASGSGHSKTVRYEGMRVDPVYCGVLAICLTQTSLASCWRHISLSIVNDAISEQQRSVNDVNGACVTQTTGSASGKVSSGAHRVVAPRNRYRRTVQVNPLDIRSSVSMGTWNVRTLNAPAASRMLC